MFIIKLIVPSVKDESKSDVYRWVFPEILDKFKRETLLDKLKSLFAPHKKFYVSWYDGTDYCSIVDDETLQDAARSLLKACPSHNTMRFYVTFDRREVSSIFGIKPQEDNESDGEQNVPDDKDDDDDDKTSKKDPTDTNPEKQKDEKQDSSDSESEDEAEKKETEKKDQNEQPKEEQDDKKEEQQQQPQLPSVHPNVQVCPSLLPQPNNMMPYYPNHPGMLYPMPMYVPVPVPQYASPKPKPAPTNPKSQTTKKQKK